MKNTKHQLRGIKRIISAAMAAAVTATALSVPMTAFAEQYDIVDDTDGVFTQAEAELSGNVSKEWNGTIADSYDGGTGTQADPYRIATGEQLALLASEVNNGNDYKGEYFMLTADILLNSDVENEPNPWTPIGHSSGAIFNGTFDGANHKVIGIYIKASYNDFDNFGLFGITASGVIENVGVTDGIIWSFDYSNVDTTFCGGICGYNGGTISNCYNANKVIAESNYVGGICGKSDGAVINDDISNKSIIKDCYNIGEINGWSAGGICAANNVGIIQDCYNKGNVTANSDNAGGICGDCNQLGFEGGILRCHNSGTVKNVDENNSGHAGGICGTLSRGTVKQCYNTGLVQSDSYGTGGICGYSYFGKITECYNTGSVQCKKSSTGGISGVNLYATIENCYNAGKIEGKNAVGGIWGHSSDGKKYSNCYNIGSVSGSYDVFPVGYIDGDGGEISNVYYNSDVCTDTDGTNSDWARTTAQLTASSALSDLGFDDSVWNKTANTSTYLYYPDLKNIDGDQPRVIVGVPAPTNVKASAGDSKVTLTWDAVEGATNYAVFLRKGSTWLKIGSSGTNTTFTSRGLENGGKYFYMVKAYVNGAWSGESDAAWAIPLCITPQNVKATAGDGKVTLTWDAVKGASNYAVFLRKGTTWLKIGASGAGTTFTSRGLANGGKYFYMVKAYVNGSWSDESAVVSATPVCITPQNVKAVGGAGQATITWDAVTGATNYAVMMKKGTSWLTLGSTGAKTSYTAKGLASGGKYYFVVKSFVNGAWSDMSETVAASIS